MAQQRVLNLSSVEYDVDLDQIDLTLDWLNCSKFICGFCNRGFKYKHVKENHEMIHTGKKPFQCQICLQSFRRSHHLKTHLRLHTGEKPYVCFLCDRKFRQRANLDRHLKSKTLCVQINPVETVVIEEPDILQLLCSLTEPSDK